MSQIHHEVSLPAAPSVVYRALLDSAEHSTFTGAPANISGEAGGALTTHGGEIEGRIIELVENSRIVEAWRPKGWPAGVYSIAKFELHDDNGATRLVFDHDGIPDEAVVHIDSGWQQMYWEPLTKHLSA